MAERAAKERETHPALRGAFRKGYVAWYNHPVKGSNPYPDHRKKDGRLTFSRAFRRAWEYGFATANREYLCRTSPGTRGRGQ